MHCYKQTIYEEL